MIEIVRSPRRLPTTRGAEWLPRQRWTLADLDRLVAAGVFDDRIELLDGDAITDYVCRRLSKDLFSIEGGWRPVESTYNEPDLRVYAKQFQLLPDLSLRLGGLGLG